MALSNIDVKIVGDYVWNDELQIYHEKKIDDFKHYFKDWLEKMGRIPRTINLNINVDYNAELGFFSITYISNREKEVVAAIKDDHYFYSTYFNKKNL